MQTPTPDLIFARGQMALSLAFHIVFAAAGVALPALMVAAELLHRRTGDQVYLELAHRWAKGTAILFAVGAVSGTALSFELGLLWPRFMAFAGAIIGMPFSLEGFAFFTEAIFLGIYLYGWERVTPRLHLLAGVAVSVSGAFSALFVVLANAWMNRPAGFRMMGGLPVDVDPAAAMFGPGWSVEVLHVLLSSYLATAVAMAAVHATFLLRAPGSRFHRAALGIAMTFAVPAALFQPISGDASARAVAVHQPAKLAALEGQFHTERGAPLRIGGWPDTASETTRYALEIPHGLSLLAFHDPDARVRGLDSFPPPRPPRYARGPRRLPDHGGVRIGSGAGGSLVGCRLGAQAAQAAGARAGREPPALGSNRGLRAARLPGARGGLGGHGGRAPTLDRLRGPAHRRRGDAGQRAGRSVRAGRRHVPEPGPGRGRAARAALPQDRGRACWMSPPCSVP